MTYPKTIYSQTFTLGANKKEGEKMSKNDLSVQYIKGVGEKRAQSLKKLGISTLYDAVHFYPRAYTDFTLITPISKLKDGETACIKATVACEVSKTVIRQKMTVFKTLATDETGIIHITVFNNKYAAEALEVNREYFFIGKVNLSYGKFEMSNPLIEPYTENLSFRPIYPQTASFRSKQCEKLIKNCLAILKESNLKDPIPNSIRRKYKLCHEIYALSNIHFPSSQKDLEIAKERLIFEELFVLQCGLMSLKSKSEAQTFYKIQNDYTNEFISSLPFTLTNAQLRCIKECTSNMKSSKPMNRLLQGDVGSGKTVVAACLIYNAVKNGFQCALMAPTEILAKQHFETFKKLLPSNINIVLLTGSVTASKKAKIKEEIKEAKTDIVIGTHAILTENTQFSRLGLVVTDEQHRFGVNQRSALSNKGKSPHILVMSATPIPRTLSLIIYGDLDISIIDELPKGRIKIDTFAVDSSYKTRIYNFIKKHLDMSLQAYIVCPLVEESETVATAAVEYAKELSQNDFKDYKVGVLHGKMKPKEKALIMSRFSSGEINLLVSTTVIEVGIDVPNAVIMVVENADMFGLSQLHQLRGRVGRGKNKSYCILISDSQTQTAKERLNAMCKTQNGFIIAEEDLKLRGPGEFFGSKQHGLPNLKIADLLGDMETLKKTRDATKEVFENDPKLQMEENAGLKEAVSRLFSQNGSYILN